MTERDELMRPVSQQDHYLHDLCVSVRELVDLLKPKPLPALAPELAELREPSPPKSRHRDALIAAEPHSPLAPLSAEEAAAARRRVKGKEQGL